MKKRVRQAAALALVLGMAVTRNMAGCAAVDPAAAETGTVSGVGGMKTELVGAIGITSLSVSLPLKARFNINPSKYDGKSIDVQVENNQSANYRITNNSTVPVYMYISGIEADKDHTDSRPAGVKDISPISKTNNISTLNSVMLAIKDASMIIADGLPANADADESLWLITANMTANNNRYCLNSAKGKMEAKTGSTGTGLNLKICGLTQNGWAPADKFSVVPALMVSTVEPSQN